MMRHFMCLALLGFAISAAAAEVTVREETRTYTVEMADRGARGSKVGNVTPGNYPVKGTESSEERTVPVLVLDNGLIEAVVAPHWGARLLRVTDHRTGEDLFQVRDTVQDMLAWQAGGVKASFPFFEHGMHLEQPAGWRIVRHDDGALSVAMDMRFSHHTDPAEATRYGRFSDEILSVVVTLRPDTTQIEWHQRKDNPNPLPRADRFWNLTCFPQEKIVSGFEENAKGRKRQIYDKAAMKAATEFIFPARWVVDHGPTTVHTSPHWSNLDNWRVSHFAIDMAGPFVGAFYPQQSVNRLRIDHHTERRAAKLYSDFWCDMVEQWGGIGDVFEHPGILRPGHAPVQFTQSFWMARDMPRVDWADENLALAVEGDRVVLATPKDHALARMLGADGRVIAEGSVGPYTTLAGVGDTSRIQVELDGEAVLDQTFPLARPAPAKETPIPAHAQAEFERLAGPNPFRLESESFASNEGTPNALSARDAAASINEADDPVLALSTARACYRLGDLEQVDRIARLFPGPEADLLVGLLTLERGGAADFGQAGWEADWLRAVVMRQQGDIEAAVQAVDHYLAKVPDAWYPRLARAVWTNDLTAASALAAEHSASPEAQIAIGLCGGEPDLQHLLDDNPSADAHCDRFRDIVTGAGWSPMPRFDR